MPCSNCCEAPCRCGETDPADSWYPHDDAFEDCWGEQKPCIICGDKQDCYCFEDAKELEEELKEAAFDNSKYNI